MPSIDVTGAAGRTSSYEVVVNGALKFSKLATGSFPASYDELAKSIVEGK